jgi:hypothetical protein
MTAPGVGTDLGGFGKPVRDREFKLTIYGNFEFRREHPVAIDRFRAGGTAGGVAVGGSRGGRLPQNQR